LKDYPSEMAARADFTSFDLDHPVPLATVENRAKYNPDLDFKCLPKNQRFLVFTTYGPDPEHYDIYYKNPKNSMGVAFQVWGIFETLEEAEKHVQYVRKYVPLCVYLNLHVVDLRSGRVELPPITDGNVENHYINKNYEEVIGPYLKQKIIEPAKNVESRVLETKKISDRLKTFIEAQKNCVDLANKEIALYSAVSEEQKNKDQIEESLSEFSTFVPPKDRTSYQVPHRDKTIEELVVELKKTIPPSLLHFHLEQIKIANGELPPNHKWKFQKYKNPETGEWVIMRVIYRKSQ